ncbi:MAG: XTP/dITP diphosphatase [Planctomycetota bacterium]|nr:MAG: XTP/dITP diphosphatase [Planctomycetota bacterium]
MRILLATRNAGKLREIRRMTRDASWTWVGLADFPDVPEAVEDGETFAENARRKALHYAAATGLPTLADDSGLEVDALGGAPGVRSARYAGEPRDDARNNARLVAELRDVPEGERTARFCCAMALAVGDKVVCEADGVVEGRIIDEPRGTNGFGYDPHFLVPDLGRTTAELPPDEKNALSHRGRALRAILPQIEAWVRRSSRAETAGA